MKVKKAFKKKHSSRKLSGSINIQRNKFFIQYISFLSFWLSVAVCHNTSNTVELINVMFMLR